MSPKDVIKLLQTPSELMRLAYLQIGGSTTRSPINPQAPLPPANGQAPVATFQVQVVDGKTVRGFTKRAGLKDRTFVKILYQPNLKNAANLQEDEFNAYYIPMVQTSDVQNNRSHYTLPVTSGSLHVMITSKLSACTFGVGMNGAGARLVSHVQPDGAISKNMRAQNLDQAITGGFAQVDGVFRYGTEYQDRAAILGYRKGHHWKFYCQLLSILNDDPSIDLINNVIKIRT